MCKVNLAANVNEKTPRKVWIRVAIVAIDWRIETDVELAIYLTAVLVGGIIDNTIPRRSMPAKSHTNPAKVKALLEEGTLNPGPEKVHDAKFRESEFFDPRDLVQVKYEMLRRVSIEKTSVTEATEEYGVSRPTYYQTKANFDQAGIAGLVPKKRGPRGPHKLQGEALAFVQQQLVAGQPVRARELAKLVRQEFGLTIHPRTIERAVSVKKTPQ